MLINVVVWSVVVGEHVPLHHSLRAKAEALWATVFGLLRRPALALLQVTPLHESFALWAPDAEDAMGSQTFFAVESLLADIANELEEKK